MRLVSFEGGAGVLRDTHGGTGDRLHPVKGGKTLDGELMQSGSTADLVHSVPALIAYLSKLMTLEPGDVVSTGTPAGVGSLRDPKVWLKPGDELEISSPQLGALQTRLA